MKCDYDAVDCIYEDSSREKCKSCPVYEAVIEGAKGCGSVEL